MLNLVSTAAISNRKSESKLTMLVLFYSDLLYNTGLALGYKRYYKISVKQQKDKNLAIVIIYYELVILVSAAPYTATART